MGWLFLCVFWYGSPASQKVELLDPVSVARIPTGILVLDRKAKCLVNLDTGKKIGRGGSGPGEFLDPVAMTTTADSIIVFDSDRGWLVFLSFAGVFQKNVPVVRGPRAVFFGNEVVIHTPLGDHLFEGFSLGGSHLFSAGKGMGDKLDPNEIGRYVYAFTLSEKVLFAVTLDGKHAEIWRPPYDKSKSVDLIFDFSQYSLDKRVRNEGPGHVLIDNNQPILDVVSDQGKILIVFKDEREEELHYLLRLDLSFEVQSVEKLPRPFKKIVRLGDSFFGLDSYDGLVVPYP